MTTFESLVEQKRKSIDRHLRSTLSSLRNSPPALACAMRYSVLNGGKRLRPFLLLSAAQAYGLPEEKALPLACAFELVHAFSLVHDDLPALDNDALRRGLPTTHRAYGEAQAILAGDALLLHAFETACETKARPDRVLKACALLARAAGACGMTGGQSADLFAEGLPGPSRRLAALKKEHSPCAWNPQSFYLLPGKSRAKPPLRAVLEYVHLNKTAQLLAAPLTAGAVLAGAPDKDCRALFSFGLDCGLAFQLTDDLLDACGDKKLLGKRGSDRDNAKLTCVSLYGLERSRKMVYSLLADAKRKLRALKSARKGALRPLEEFADFIAVRDH